MATIKPFRAIRPLPEYAAAVAALPYDVLSREEAELEIQNKPYSFLRIDKSEATLERQIDHYADEVYERALNNYQEFLKKNILSQDRQASFYLYQLTMNGHRQTGLVCAAAVDDYEKNIIKKHENTRADKEADRIRHVDTLNANTGPIFLIYRQRERIHQLIDQILAEQPESSFTADDGVLHQIWKISDKELNHSLEQAFAEVESLYIADGHHRCASAAAVAKKRRQQFPNYSGQEAFNYFLAVLFPDNELQIMDYNRLVKDLNGLSEAEFLEILGETFLVEKSDESAVKPARKAEFSMYLNHNWYCLKLKQGLLQQADPIKSLDVSILQDYLLQPILGIKDPRTDQRIDFVGGIRGLAELERRVDSSEMAVAFAMYPTALEELFAVADQGLLMPPKSTWFEPKLRSGLFIHSLAD